VHLQPIWQVLADNNVDLVLTGHDHHYERFLPMTATGVVDTVAASVGSSVAPAGSPFAACLRDAHTLGSHIVVGPGMQEHAAKIRFGLIEETLLV